MSQIPSVSYSVVKCKVHPALGFGGSTLRRGDKSSPSCCCAQRLCLGTEVSVTPCLLAPVKAWDALESSSFDALV